jgi:hypothetical protein
MALTAGLLFDFYFDLNDDVLMKDILSGAYTGTPAGHNIQMLYPVSALISLFYRLFQGADWYGIFLCGAQFGCIFLILWRSLVMLRRAGVQGRQRLLVVLTEAVVILSVLLPHLVYVQYTVTAALLSGTAAFLLLTGAGRKNDLAACIMIWLAYLIRSEMLLLTLPVVAVALFIRWRMEQRRGQLRKYILLGSILLAGIAAGALANRLAYSSPQWKQFESFFDYRTEVYDFQGIPEYQDNREFYDSIGLSEDEQALLVNYNFGLDQEIDANCMGKIAAYAAVHNQDEKPFAEKLQAALKAYIYRLHHLGLPQTFEYPQTDAPWNLLTAVLFLAALVLYLTDYVRQPGRARFRIILWVLLLFAADSVLWGYILVRGRDPIRITHPLYLMEMVVLGGLILKQVRGNGQQRIRSILAVLLLVCAAVYLPSAYHITAAEQQERAQSNAPYQEMRNYCRAHADSFYFMDVYSSVSYSEKMFADVDNTLVNCDIMGGWACKSPLQAEKFAVYGFKNMQSALLQEHVYFIQCADGDTSWIVKYYQAQGIQVSLQKTDTVGGSFAVYQIRKAETK